MPTEFYPVISEEPSSCFGCHERKVQHQIQLNASEFNGCPSELSLVSTVKWLQTPLLSNRTVEWMFTFILSMAAEKLCIVLVDFFFLYHNNTLSPPLQPWLGLVPRWRPGEGQAFVELCASWRCVQCGAPVSAPVRLQLQALWRHGCKPVN